MNLWFLIPFGTIFIVMGFILIVIGSLQQIEREKIERRNSQTRTEIKGGGVIMIGPIPIIFGSDYKYAAIAIMLAIILIVMVIFFTLWIQYTS